MDAIPILGASWEMGFLAVTAEGPYCWRLPLSVCVSVASCDRNSSKLKLTVLFWINYE